MKPQIPPDFGCGGAVRWEFFELRLSFPIR